LLTVSEQFKHIQLSATLPKLFIEPLLEQLEVENIENQVIVLEILEVLIDKNKNRNIFNIVSIDHCFKVLEQGQYNSLFLNNLFTACALFLFECHSDDNIWMQVDLMEDMQDLALQMQNPNLSCQLHSTCLALLTLITSVNLPDVTEYRLRNDKAPLLLSTFASRLCLG
jgi:hypothetical protein